MAEHEILEELEELSLILQSYGPDAHWFCPKRDDEDTIDYHNFDPPTDGTVDMSPEAKRELIEEGKQRQGVAYKYSIGLGLDMTSADMSVAAEQFKDYALRKHALLTTCSDCIRNYHMGRKAYLRYLHEKLDDEERVGSLAERLLQFDFHRINTGLQTAKDILDAAPPEKWTQSLLMKHDQTTLLAVYEALCCPDFHASEKELSRHFNYVFEGVQRKKELKLHDIVPAMTHFLYTTDELKVRWAASSWERIETMLDLDTFEWAVQGSLVKALVTLQSSDAISVQAFWLAFTLVLKRMDLKLITQTLPGLEVQPSIFTRLLDHTHSTSDGVVRVVIQALHLLTQKAPRVLWSAFGSTSASTVVELIFKSLGYHQLLRDDQNFDSLENSPVVGWMPDFLLSQGAIHQVETCRSLVNGLLITFQGCSWLSEKAKRGLLYSGLNALYVTLESFNDPSHKLNPTTDLIAISLILKFIDEHKVIIINIADLPDSEQDGADLKRISLKVLGAVFNLDCKTISAESVYLEEDTPVERAPRTHSQSIWNSVLDIFRPGNLALAKSILSGLPAITGVDEILPSHRKDISKMSKPKVAHNKDYHDLQENISKVFARLSDFRSTELQTLRQAPETCFPLFAALLSPNDNTYEAMIEVLKQMTDELGKEEAFSVLLNQSLPEFLNSYNLAVNKVRAARNFGPMSHMLKSGGEVLKALCGNTGVLRSRNNLVKREKQLVYTWWVTQWRTLDVLFSTLEAWAPRVDKDTTYMQDFCRDGMEYAEALFDRYRIVASAMREPDAGAEDKDAEQRVLRAVCDNINGLTMLLRLRDAYLITVITSFLGKLLRSLGQYELEVEDRASQYIKDACKSEREPGFRRTNLTNQQKAELNRVLQEHQGLEIVEVHQKSTTRKQPTLDSWSSSAGGQVHQPRLPPPSTKSVVPNRSGTTAAGLGLSSFGLAKLQAEQQAKKQKEENAAVQSKDFLNKRKQAALELQRQKDKAREQAAALRRPVGVAGEGSGMHGLRGVDGKDHAPIRSEIMVGSSDEDSSDDDDDVDGDVGLLKLRRKGKSGTVTEYQESKRLAMLKAQGPVKKTKVQRSAKDLRARVEPNMDSLYTEILSWDLFHQGDEPPSKVQCRKIVDKFYDPLTYKDTFKPLLISEVWRSLVTARDENMNKSIEITILSRASVDKFMEITSKMPISTKNDFKFKERDIILLSRGTDPINNPTEAHCLARVDRTNRKKDVVEVTFRVSRTISQELVQGLSPNLKVSAVKVSDMTTTQREYAALSSLEYYDLCMEVLEAQPSPIQKQSENQMDEVVKRYNLNRGQAKAILAAYDNDGFTCIQGPPGSGKTKTIVSMVGALLTPSLQQEASGVRPAIRGQAPAAVQPKKKLLICAPSNAAVDELVVRLMEGIVPRTGTKQKINVIRLGRSDVINDSVKSVMLDELVRMKLEGDQTEKNKLMNDRDKLHSDAGQIKERLNLVRASLEDARIRNDKPAESTLQREFDALKRSQAHIGAKIDADKESGNTVSRQNEINRRKYQQEIIDGAHVLCATLSGSGHDMFRNLNVEFETVIIDEAAQCIELSALIPLKYGCTKCILVGDPEQLPPTVLSRSAQSFGYEQSLFVRMQKNFPEDIHLLDTQYRMHPEISRFPSEQFYHGKLLDGPGMAKLRDQPWHESATLGPYRFFDVEGVQTKEARGHSFINIPELNAAMQLYRRIKTDYGNTVDLKGKIGIIATYKAQLIELRNRFAHTFGDKIFEEIEFNTTDAFQGREREIIIFSCVRATQTGGIGFLKDIRRMNVGLTRAKSSLWVLGDSRSLQQGEFWNKLIQDAKSRDRYTGGDVMSLLAKPTRKDRKAPSVQASSLLPQPERKLSSVGLQSVKIKTEVKKELDNDVEMTDAPSSKRPGSPMVKVEDKKTKVETEKAKPPMDDLSKALEAKKAADAARRPQLSNRPLVPMRKKAPVDPFIQRKKPPPKR